jgi:hypothetical protein
MSSTCFIVLTTLYQFLMESIPQCTVVQFFLGLAWSQVPTIVLIWRTDGRLLYSDVGINRTLSMRLNYYTVLEFKSPKKHASFTVLLVVL